MSTRGSSIHHIGLGVVLSLLLSAAVRAADEPSSYPIYFYTWHGYDAPPDIDAGQGALCTQAGDNDERDERPTRSSVRRMRQADLIYILNHGGSLWTNPPASAPEERTRLDIRDNTKWTTDDGSGPSLIVAWGCQNGNDRYQAPVSGELNLLKELAAAFGIQPDSRTKVYLAPKINVSKTLADDTFQTAFFAAFSRGDVTVEKAARQACEQWDQGHIGLTESRTFDDLIGICGNKNLTLNQLRANLAARAKAGRSGLVGIQQTLVAWYCTNHPKVTPTFGGLPELMSGSLPKPGLDACQAMIARLLWYWKARGLNTDGLEEFKNYLLLRVGNRASVQPLPDFIRPATLAPLPPSGEEARKKWVEDAQRAALAWLARTLAADEFDKIADQLSERRAAFEEYDAGFGAVVTQAAESVRQQTQKENQ